MAASSPLDLTFDLSDLLDPQVLRELCSRAHAVAGAPVAVCDRTGVELSTFGPAPPVEARVAEIEIGQTRVVAGSTVAPIELDADVCGRVIIGAPDAQRPAAFLAAALSALVYSAWARRLASEVHEAAQLENSRELEEKNRRLGEMVERLREVDRLKSSFLATVSHELRTPLTSVIGYSEMLLEGLAGELSPEQREYVSTIMDKGDQLLSLISSILEISRIEAGSTRITRQKIDLAVLLTEVVDNGQAQANRRRIDLRLQSDEPFGPALLDRDKIRQALVAVVGNAIKFTPEGGHVRVELAKAAAAAEIRVIDDGIGIPAAALPRVFDAFYQVDSSPTREYGGAGLGLTIARSFVRAHGGEITIESTPGKGTTVVIALPLGAQP